MRLKANKFNAISIRKESYIMLLLCVALMALLFAAGRSISVEFSGQWKLPITIGFMAAVFIIQVAKLEFDSRFGLVIIGLAFCISIVLMYFIWEPFLSQYYSTNVWFGSFDPARIYVYSKMLCESNFTETQWWDFSGAFYVYGAFMWVSGMDPFAHTVIHYFLLGTGVAHLITSLRLCGSGLPAKFNWMLFGVFLLPEVFFYMNLTSKDTILLILLTWFMSFLLRFSFYKRSTFGLFVLLSILIISASIRGSMIFMLALMAYIPVWVNGKWIHRIITLVGGLIILTILVRLSSSIGFLDIREYLQTKSNSTAAFSHDFNSSSFGAAMVSDNPIIRVLLAPIRVIAYWIAPLLENPFYSRNFFGSYGPMSSLCAYLTSLVYLVTLPFAFTHCIQTIYNKNRKSVDFALVLMFIMLEFAMANGIQIIHARYRIMLSVILWVMIVKGLSAEPKLLKSICYIWIAILLAGITSYLVFKTFLA